MAKTLAILNPVSGNGAGKKLSTAIQAALRENNLAFEWHETRAPLDATIAAERAKRDGYTTVIAIGGDGLVHEVVNGLLKASNEQPVGTLAVLPIGNGNDFAKMLPLPPDWREGIRRIVAGNTRWFDVGKITGDKPAPGIESSVHYFDNGMDTGFGALVSLHAHDAPAFITGTAMYLLAIAKTLRHYYIPHLKVTLDAKPPYEQDSTMFVVSLGQCMGNAFWMTPDALMDDGWFDLCVADGLGRAGILSIVPKLMNKTHLGDPRLKFYKAKRVILESAGALVVEIDGEIPFIDAHRLEVEILPSRLQVIA